ncbi:hypothetical protein [Kribbella sp. ALI-6-A]|uniref:hypothetical protein n=1 Tax=Kribbella sp. ALI-6-A TaxID=1933817 RepID=UPI00143D7506|nr:hypothetical protein [Kribbella sp. ALI-6-A]
MGLEALGAGPDLGNLVEHDFQPIALTLRLGFAVVQYRDAEFFDLLEERRVVF